MRRKGDETVHVFYVNRAHIPGYVEQWEKSVVAVRKDCPHWPSDPRAHAIMCLRGFMDGCDVDPEETPLVAAAYLVSRSDKSEHITGPRTMIVLEENGFEVTEVLRDEIPTIH